MQFIIEDKEYSVAEFLDKFGDNLPQIVTVSQGYCGDIIEDTFCKDQILRLHTVSRQKRVVAKTTVSGESKVLSIPLNYKDLKLCVIERNGKVGKEKSVSDILKSNPRLPIRAHFPRDKSITLGDYSIGTSFIPVLELTHTFEEVYMLGNTVDHISGALLPEVIPVPLYLPQLRLSLITGVDEYYYKDGWDKFIISLSLSASKLRYKKEFGNPEIAEYKPVAATESVPDDTYQYITPQCYVNASDVFSGRSTSWQRPTKHTPSSDINQVNVQSSQLQVDVGKRREILNPTYTKNTANSEEYSYPSSLTTHKETTQVSCIYEEIDITQRKSSQVQPTLVNNDTIFEKSIPSLQSSKQENNHGLYKELKKTVNQRATPNKPPVTVDKVRLTSSETLPPSLPPRSQDKPIKVEPSVKTIIYENDIPRGKVVPVQKNPGLPKAIETETGNQPQTMTRFDSAADKCPKNSNMLLTNDKEYICLVTPIHTRDDIKKLTIDDVSEYLKILGLEKYVESFRDDLIDGEMLSDLDRNILKEDFGMRSVEAMRLMMFVEKGHMPR